MVLWTRQFGVAGLVILLSSTISTAKPITDDGSTGPAKWRKPITVFIPRDPEPGRNRHDKLKDAVDQWKAVAGPNVPAINTVILNAGGNDPSTGKPPDTSAEGAVTVTWGNKTGEATPVYLGEPTGQKDKNGNDIIKNQIVKTVAITIDPHAGANPAADDQKAFATMLHEFGHALQIDHSDESDSVMQPILESYVDKNKPGNSDLRELGSLYTAFSGRLDGDATLLAGGLWEYTYSATWLSGGEIPLFQVVTLGAAIENLNVPEGWELKGYPDDYGPNILAFRVAPTDALQAYLNATNPSITVSFDSVTAPQMTGGWLGTDVSIVGPVPVPEPSSLALLLAASAAAAIRRRYHGGIARG
jgi:hypothetical protein